MNELAERVALIEQMIDEGQRSVERWSWTYVLWGIGHCLGVVASFVLPEERSGTAWAALMGACALVTAGGTAWRYWTRRVKTSPNRALKGVWWALGLVVLSLLLSPLTLGSLPGWYSFFCVAYGGAFFASGQIVRWTPMSANGVLWWAAGLAMHFLPAPSVLGLFGGTALVGEIGFGVYAMVHERRTRAGER